MPSGRKPRGAILPKGARMVSSGEKEQTYGWRERDDPARVAEPHGLVGPVPLGFRTTPPPRLVRAVLVSEEIHAAFSPVEFTARLLIEEVRTHASQRPQGDEWWFWTGQRRSGAGGRTFLVAQSPNVPKAIATALRITFEAFVGATGVKVRERHTVREDLDPLLWLGDDGLELLSMW
jgi:hypothetical protein